MPEIVPLTLRLTGQLADQHEFEGYDGYMALAGFAWMLSLVANYSETGKIRQRGDFEGRRAVRATAPREGSVITEYLVYLDSIPREVFGSVAATVTAAALFKHLTKRVISRNLGQDGELGSDAENALMGRREGDVETLVAISEAPIRQAHSIIGNGASQIEIISGANILNTFNQSTKDYVRLDYHDDEITCKNVSVSAFNANSGYGSVFDFDLGRTVPISMNSETFKNFRHFFSWGLDQYTRRTNQTINICYTKILAMDGRPKRYIIKSASPAV